MFVFSPFAASAFLLLFSFSGGAIYNLKSNKEGQPKNVSGKYWLLVAQGCHSCSELLKELETFCSGKKPPSSNIGFFAAGSSPQALLKKLSAFKADYELFSGSPNEFYESYQMMGTPSLKIKGQKKSAMGKEPVLKALKKDKGFCSA